MVHKIPETIVLYFFLMQSFESKNKINICLLIFSLSTPFGAWIGERIPQAYYHPILAFVCGIFIHISTHILFESSDKKHRFRLSKIVVFLLNKETKALLRLFY